MESPFAAAETGDRLSRRDYKRALGPLREQLLEDQVQLREEGVPVILLFAGVDCGGKSESATLLTSWMDARWVTTRAFDEPTTEERERPRFWRYWRDLPAAGHIGIFLSAWYHDPLLDRVHNVSDDAAFERQLEEIRSFETMLARDGAIVLKFWMHLSKDAQRERFEALEADPLQRWRVTRKDWDNWRLYDQFVDVGERIIRATDTPEAPWTVVEGADPHTYGLRVGTVVHETIQARLDAHRARKAEPAEPREPDPPPDDREDTLLCGLDMSQTLDKSEYKVELEKAQGLLNLLHRRTVEDGRSMILVFQGWDAGGKGGAIRRVIAPLDARFYRVVPIGAPTEEEKAYHYLWRFWRHLPRAGRVSIFDRSWYGRVLVERVEGFATHVEWGRAYDEINAFEKELADSGIILLKFWMHITKAEQKQRFDARRKTPYKRWKLTDEDWRNRERWEHYEVAAHDMIEKTDTPWAPWVVVAADCKRFARVKVVRSVCDRMKAGLRD
ncbi:MAG: polyphosphate:AMP phosphotransferase [Planctomycetota bacterium]